MKEKPSALAAHAMALFTIVVWGTTFIASKLLLDWYTPLQVMLMRFVLAYVVLLCLRPKLLVLPWKEELYMAALGFFGCTVYFLAENTALTYTLAANVSIIVATAPILTALLAHVALKDEQVGRNNVLGFVIAIVGVALVVFNGTFILKLNPIGDLLSLGAAVCWAVYSVLLKRRVAQYDSILLTRRVMLWGFVTALPMAFAEGAGFSLAPLADGALLFCVVFLGVVGSGICYVLWNIATRRLGIVVVNNYIYVNPFATMVAAGLVLHEPISWMGIVGAVLILLGVFVSDRKVK